MTDKGYLNSRDQYIEQQKLKLDVYFKTDTPESTVLAFQSLIADKYKGINIVYISREQALSSYRDKNSNDQIAMQALKEVGGNPFGAEFKIPQRVRKRPNC